MIPKHFKMYPQGSLKICCEYHGNPAIETFYSQMSTCWWDQKKSQRVTKFIKIHPLGTMNVCRKCHGNPFNGCDISVWTNGPLFSSIESIHKHG